jgi:glycosyltransferase involved in cell wall biosynthesis
VDSASRPPAGGWAVRTSPTGSCRFQAHERINSFMNKRVLFVSYLFPPVGGAGVQRAAKFVKYLPAHGWTPSVLTVANPSVPVFDDSLSAEVPPQVLIRRAMTWEPSYAVKIITAGAGQADASYFSSFPRLARFLARGLIKTLLQPDPQVLWLPGAMREGLKLLREVRHDVIFATAPPFSSFLVAARLSRHSGLPLVLDYRDEWTICTAHWENRRQDLLSRYIQRRLQYQVLRQARVVIATTRSSAEALAQICLAADSKALVTHIYNGFDAIDFPVLPPSGQNGSLFRLVYVGTLWNLASIDPLVEAVREFASRTPALAPYLELVLAGRRTQQQQQRLEALKALPCRVSEYPYLDHRRSLELLSSATMSCILLSDLPGTARVVPAKVFECMAARRPVLAIAPRGELTELLSRYAGAHIFHPRETLRLAAFLAEQVGRFQAGSYSSNVCWDGDAFSRTHAARQLADLLGVCAGTAASTRPGRTERPLEFAASTHQSQIDAIAI